MLLVLSVAFVPALLSVWQTLDCDRASDVCRDSRRFLGIAISTHTFSASSLRGARLVDFPSHTRGPPRHHWDVVLETTDGEHRVHFDASSEQDEELRRESRAIASFISRAAPGYKHVSFNVLNLVALFLLLPAGWAAARAGQLVLRIWRLG
ncbi:MAG TPA: hypothetical protein VHB79_04035 [Polyangiaceae bacterium]|nr:hypothetical protein [Polyangiaceae bacterium]